MIEKSFQFLINIKEHYLFMRRVEKKFVVCSSVVYE
jgi:hypothetical protein